MKKTAVIVDPGSSGLLLPRNFEARGLDVVALRYHDSSPCAEWRDAGIRDVINAGRNTNAILAALEGRKIVCVVPGSEQAIDRADQLAFHLGVEGNDPGTSAWRRDKAQMGRAIVRAGLPAAREFVADSLPAVERGLAALSFPVVLKPLCGAGSDNVRVCNSLFEACEHFRRIMGGRNKIGTDNHAVLCQEFLDGQQYLINTISHQSRHRVAEIWKFDTIRRKGHPLYDTQELIDPCSKLADDLVAYTLNVLDALRLEHGVGHTEIILTREGPRLLETAARLPGKIAEATMTRAVGRNLVDLCSDCFVTPEALQALPDRYRRYAHVAIVALQSPWDGCFGTQSVLNRLQALASYSQFIGLALRPGQAVQETVDLYSSPGLVYLFHQSRDTIVDDILTIRRLEQDGGLFIRAVD